jgi:hypothetical protein
LLYFHHTSSLHHDARELSPDHPDVPERIKAIEAAMALTDGRGANAAAEMACQVRDAAARLGAPVGAVLGGGYDKQARPTAGRRRSPRWQALERPSRSRPSRS